MLGPQYSKILNNYFTTDKKIVPKIDTLIFIVRVRSLKPEHIKRQAVKGYYIFWYKNPWVKTPLIFQRNFK